MGRAGITAVAPRMLAAITTVIGVVAANVLIGPSAAGFLRPIDGHGTAHMYPSTCIFFMRLGLVRSVPVAPWEDAGLGLPCNWTAAGGLHCAAPLGMASWTACRREQDSIAQPPSAPTIGRDRTTCWDRTTPTFCPRHAPRRHGQRQEIRLDSRPSYGPGAQREHATSSPAALLPRTGTHSSTSKLRGGIIYVRMGTVSSMPQGRGRLVSCNSRGVGVGSLLTGGCGALGSRHPAVDAAGKSKRFHYGPRGSLRGVRLRGG